MKPDTKTKETEYMKIFPVMMYKKTKSMAQNRASALNMTTGEYIRTLIHRDNKI